MHNDGEILTMATPPPLFHLQHCHHHHHHNDHNVDFVLYMITAVVHFRFSLSPVLCHRVVQAEKGFLS